MDLDKQQFIGLFGGVLLLLGVFLPILSIPVIGSVSLFGLGRIEGYVLLGLTVLSLISILFNKLKFLKVTALTSLLLVFVSFVSTIYKIKTTKAEIGNNLKDNPFGGMAESMMDMIQIQYGWVFLFLGGLILIYVAFAKHELQSFKKLESDIQPPIKHVQVNNRTKLVSNDGLAYHSGHRTKFDENGVEQKNCPDCRELIRFDARKCKHCGSMVVV